MKKVILFKDKVCAREDCSYCISMSKKDFKLACFIINDCLKYYEEDCDYIENQLLENGISFSYDNSSRNVDAIFEVNC